MSDVTFNEGMGVGGQRPSPPLRELIGNIELLLGENDNLLTKLTELLSPMLEPEPSTIEAESSGSDKMMNPVQPSEVRDRLQGLFRRLEQRNSALLRLMNRVNI